MNQNNKRTRVAGLAVIILLALAIIGVVAYYFISNNSKKTTTKTTASAVVVTNNTQQNNTQTESTATKPDTTRITNTNLATDDFLQFAQTELTNKCTSMTVKGQIGDNVVVNFAFGEEVNGVCEPSGGALRYYHKNNGVWALAFGTQSEVPCSKFAEFTIPRELPSAETCLDLATNKTITNPITSQ